MPEGGELEILPKICAKSPGTKVLILSAFFKDDLIVEASQRSVKGYLPKTLMPGGVVKATRATYAGELWAECKVLTQTLESLLRNVHGLHGLLSRIFNKLKVNRIVDHTA